MRDKKPHLWRLWNAFQDDSFGNMVLSPDDTDAIVYELFTTEDLH